MDDVLKQKLMFSAVAFNFAVIVFQIGFNSGLFGMAFSMPKLILALLVGLIVGGITFAVTHFMQR